MSIEDSCISLCMHCHFLCLLWMLLKKSRLGRWGFRNVGLVDEVLIDALSFHEALVRFTESVGILLFLLITILWCNKSNKSLFWLDVIVFILFIQQWHTVREYLLTFCGVELIWESAGRWRKGSNYCTLLLHRSHEKSPHARQTWEKM